MCLWEKKLLSIEATPSLSLELPLLVTNCRQATSDHACKGTYKISLLQHHWPSVVLDYKMLQTDWLLEQ